MVLRWLATDLRYGRSGNYIHFHVRAICIALVAYVVRLYVHFQMTLRLLGQSYLLLCRYLRYVAAITIS